MTKAFDACRYKFLEVREGGELEVESCSESSEILHGT